MKHKLLTITIIQNILGMKVKAQNNGH